VRTSAIKLQLDNAAGGRLKRNSRPSAVLFYFSFFISFKSFIYFIYFTMCDGP